MPQPVRPPPPAELSFPPPPPPQQQEPAYEPEPPPTPQQQEPLAGPNVMNVVMVGAECAPWSKTGACLDLIGTVACGCPACFMSCTVVPLLCAPALRSARSGLVPGTPCMPGNPILLFIESGIAAICLVCLEQLRLYLCHSSQLGSGRCAQAAWAM